MTYYFFCYLAVAEFYLQYHKNITGKNEFAGQLLKGRIYIFKFRIDFTHSSLTSLVEPFDKSLFRQDTLLTQLYTK